MHLLSPSFVVPVSVGLLPLCFPCSFLFVVLRGSFLLLLLFGVCGWLVAVSFLFCPCVLGACGLARSLLVSPPPSLPTLVSPLCLLVQLVLCSLRCNGPVVIPSIWRVLADWLLSSLLLMATKASPCVGLCPLHHVVGVVQVPLAPALRYSPLGDPETP